LTDELTETRDRKQTLTTTRTETSNDVENIEETTHEPVVTSDTVTPVLQVTRVSQGDTSDSEPVVTSDTLTPVSQDDTSVTG